MSINIGLNDDGEAEYGRLGIGGTKAVGDGELRDTIGGVLNINKRDNDVKDLLSELLLGKTDGTGDDKPSDGVAGIDGVELISLDGNSFTIQLSNGRSTDTIVFSGEGVAKIIQDVADMSGGGLDFGNKNSQFVIIDADELAANNGNKPTGSTNGELNDVIGGSGININNRNNDVLNLASEFLTGENPRDDTGESPQEPGIDGVELIDIDADSFAFKTNGDTVLIVNAGDEIASVATQADVGDSKTTAEIADQTDISNPNSFIGGTSGELNDVVGGSGIDINNNNDDVENLVLEYTTGSNPRDNSFDDTSGIDGTTLIGLDEDSLTFQTNGDTIIVQHDYFDIA
ncbi:MAG: hypothetical protein AAF681_13180 [Pseudomonadota bacterium]